MIYTVENVPTGTQAFVDGKKIDMCFYADTDSGFVRAYFDPPRVHRVRHRLRWRKIRGQVEVKFPENSPKQKPESSHAPQTIEITGAPTVGEIFAKSLVAVSVGLLIGVLLL